jgi:hypothetical protein
VLTASVVLSALLTAKCIPRDVVLHDEVGFDRTSVEGPASGELLGKKYEVLVVVDTAEGIDIADVQFRKTQDIAPTRALAKQIKRDRRRDHHFTCGGGSMPWEPVSPGVYEAVVIENTAEFRFETRRLEIDADRMHAVLTVDTQEGPVRIHYRGSAHAQGCSLVDRDRGPSAWAVALMMLVLLLRRPR